MKRLLRFLFPREDVRLGCNESGDSGKDPRGCWNVRCQLGRMCCRPGVTPSADGADLAAHAIEELHQLGYTICDGRLIPPANLHELARVAGFSAGEPAGQTQEKTK